MNINDAITKVTESNPDEANVINDFISGMKSKNIVSLGTDEAFTLVDASGEIKAFKQRVSLSLQEKTLIQPVPGGPIVVSALGYEVIADRMGANVIFPSDLTVGNKTVPNPHTIEDENGDIKRVYVRAVAFKFSSKGIRQVSDWTCMYDRMQYRLIDLLAKAKKYKHAFALYPKGAKPPESNNNQRWAEYPFDSSTSLFIDVAHDESLNWFKQIINREKKILDFAQSFAKRNATKHLVNIQSSPGAFWDFDVICWRHVNGSPVKWDMTTYKQLKNDVIGSISGEAKQKQIEIKTGTETINEENIELTDIDPEDQDKVIDIKKTKPEKKVEEKPEPVYTAAEQKIINNYETAKKSLPDYFKQALKELKCVDSPDPKQAKRIMQKINEIIDKENA